MKEKQAVQMKKQPVMKKAPEKSLRRKIIIKFFHSILKNPKRFTPFEKIDSRKNIHSVIKIQLI